MAYCVGYWSVGRWAIVWLLSGLLECRLVAYSVGYWSVSWWAIEWAIGVSVGGLFGGILECQLVAY